MNLQTELRTLEGLTVGELHARYAELFGESARSRHRQYLIRKIAWRLQADAEGGLSERAKARAAELADIGFARTTPPRYRKPQAAPAQQLDRRLPPVGAVIRRVYKGRELRVLVMESGFEHEGVQYASLSAVAKAVTGSHVNGFLFFGLNGGGR